MYRVRVVQHPATQCLCCVKAFALTFDNPFVSEEDFSTLFHPFPIYHLLISHVSPGAKDPNKGKQFEARGHTHLPLHSLVSNADGCYIGSISLGHFSQHTVAKGPFGHCRDRWIYVCLPGAG